MASDPPVLTEQQELQRRANQVTDEVSGLKGCVVP